MQARRSSLPTAEQEFQIQVVIYSKPQKFAVFAVSIRLAGGNCDQRITARRRL
jgi:hypothetical protein